MLLTHYFDSDPDPAFHFDAAPDPDPTFHSDANPEKDLAFQFDRILPLFFPDLYPPTPQNDPLRLPPFHFDADPDPAFHFDADLHETVRTKKYFKSGIIISFGAFYGKIFTLKNENVSESPFLLFFLRLRFLNGVCSSSKQQYKFCTLSFGFQ